MKVRPDFIFPKFKLAVFVDGCFWHGCPRHGTQPKGNRAFWKNKFARNRARDRLVNRALRAAHWRVVRIWECALKKNPLNCLRRVRRVLRQGHRAAPPGRRSAASLPFPTHGFGVAGFGTGAGGVVVA